MEAKYGEGAYAKQDNSFKVQEPLIDRPWIVIEITKAESDHLLRVR